LVYESRGLTIVIDAEVEELPTRAAGRGQALLRESVPTPHEVSITEFLRRGIYTDTRLFFY
jgi:hypothetical protein